MATMYPLFFGVLLAAVCGIVGTGDGFIVWSNEYCVLRLGECLELRDTRESIWDKFKHRSNTGASSKTNAGASLPTRARIIRIATPYVSASKQENNIPPLGVRGKIIQIASAELGVREATGRNDGKRVEEYLRYTDLGKGHPWCAAFVSWCYGQAGLSQPRNPWSPALFPKARTYPSLGARGTSLDAGAGLPTRAPVNQADIFGIYGATARRINHVGLVRDVQGKYLITVEGNSNDRVESRRRHLSTIYALADWVD